MVNTKTAIPNTSGVKKVAIKKRLVFYREQADSQFWDSIWESQETERLYQEAMAGALGYFEDIFPRYLPKQGQIVEAGCGLGQLVIALRQRGYAVEGVDYAKETITELKKRFPEIPFRIGDVTDFDVADGYYTGYISIGVVEHALYGPDAFFPKAYRVLKPGGVALISVPYFNSIRRLKALFGQYPSRPGDLPFYQYAFTKSEFSGILSKSGFEVIDAQQYGGFKGITDELSFLQRVFTWPQGWRLRKWLMNSVALGKLNGHMIMFVAVKNP